MDHRSYTLIQSILQTQENISVIECTLQAPTLLFHTTLQIVVSGAEMHWDVNGHPLPINTLITVNKGDILKGGFAKSKFRGYIGFSHHMEVTQHYGSTSSYSSARFGANHGQLLRKGQIITFNKLNTQTPKQPSAIQHEESEIITIHKGPEYGLLDQAALDSLTTSPFTISPQSNRMGARLIGPTLTTNQKLDKSVPVLPGFIQLLPSGQLIILLQDGQTTGGYPRIAYLTLDALSLFNQIALGKQLRFRLD